MEYQKVQTAYYHKRSEEVLNPLPPAKINRKRESYTQAIQEMYSQVDDTQQEKEEKSISSIQARLTGGED